MEEIHAYYSLPLLDMVYQSAQTHRRHHNPREVQVCQVISIKTGGCSEDCAYCAQSSRYPTLTPAEKMMPLEMVLEKARYAIQHGASRICLAAGWRSIRPGKAFDQIIEMAEGVDQDVQERKGQEQ